MPNAESTTNAKAAPAVECAVLSALRPAHVESAKASAEDSGHYSTRCTIAVILNEVKDLTVEVWIAQSIQRDQRAFEGPSLSLGMTSFLWE